MKNILALISIVSFLLIPGLHYDSLPTIFFYIVDVISSLFIESPKIEIVLQFILIICIIGAFTVFLSEKKNRNLKIFCFIALMIFAVYFSYIWDGAQITTWFVVDILVFMISSLLIIIKDFKKELQKVNVH
ncbi:hypothetical protein HZQ19_02965 [Elizabethkingia anophelis]|uniref:hypothetical protein n=1 Tax=Elizabethkingia anophelis TaxID=1117645 RepID=UPI00038A452E|nr:hypothetical protein [Elizabethkingia anophelis]EQB90973.1 hypothetical protein C874_14780 [Elizabethkingia anophelis 502]MCT3760820.1 hypothetical protein [Elizabethkingia anophelis]MCT3958856.1 hypothetical protein [Elizabethkingia anophelis]MCT3972352.1 hypothetical protein [Elizabethkingia anophelis]MCT4000828.1 hypothetical protein [Elizabethkingia anophelis]